MVGSCCHGSNNKISVDITNTSPNRTTVRLQIPFLNNDTNFYIPTGEKKTVLIDPSIQRDGTFKDSRGIKISADHDISVLVTNAFNNSNNIDSYNILPITELGNEYNIYSYLGTVNFRGSEMLVAAVKNNTKVTLMNQTDVIQSIILNEFEIFQYLYSQGDLTGTHVNSDKNVYVVSGSTHTGIPSGSTEYIASEIFPVSSWSNSYIIPPVLPKSAFIIRIVTNSSRDVTLANSTRTYKLNPSSIKDQYFGTEAVVATCESPFSVTQYGVNYAYGSIAGDPFMVAVPGVDTYINEYIFTVPHEYYSVKYHAAIIVPKTGIAGLVLDNRSIQSYNSAAITVPSPFDEFKIFTFPINEGYHHFYHPVRSIKYGVFIYGHGNYLSNSFYAGYDLRRTKMCYSCDDLSHIDLCDTVKQCNSQEVCYVERYKDGGQIKYKSGCLPQNTCESKRNESTYSDGICFECCCGSYCNNQGCGENGIPNRDKRGPICFDCQHVSSPDECVNITPCDSNQVCRIEEFKWFDHSHYKLGCGHGLCDPVSRKRSHVFKRSTPVCQSCCTDDYCNKYCTASTQDQTGAVIVG
ncbi:IgGFc-binding protein-like isoform X2 [Ruditapes philippinarum]|uniref:IgGFc-binding protein-like isoform X2 n=1 Tax=Ruditapes philippinarum TaxID=129788 RepID=UPI00295B511D|nr:IgGFc-binding protein-like isoform X2 [Ruditapes philippinarum]